MISGLTIKELMEQSHKTALEKGWWDGNKSFPEQIALQHSELSEALEDFRDGHHFQEIYYECNEDNLSEPLKPCGIAIEFADLLIRVADTCEMHGIPLEEALLKKLKYNKSRPYRHGNKKA